MNQVILAGLVSDVRGDIFDLDVEDGYTFQCLYKGDVKVGAKIKVIGKLVIVEGILVQVQEVV